VLCPFPWGSCVPIKHNVTWAEAYLCTKWHLDPSSCLATVMGRQLGAAVPFGGNWVPISHNVAWAEGYLRTSGIMIHSAVWTQYIGRKVGAAVPLLGGGLGHDLTQCGLGRGLPPCNHLATIHQRHRQTDR